MNQETIFNSKNTITVIIITTIVVIFGLIFSLIQTPKYKSSAKLLVIFSQENMSPYTSAQTSNYIAGILEEVIYSNSFVDSVFKTSFELKDDLGYNQEKRLENWKKMVQTDVQESKGIIMIDVYNKDRKQANNFAQAISFSLITNHTLYHGSGDKVSVKMISTPESPEHWSEPNVLQNSLLSLLAGIFLGITFVIVFPRQNVIGFLSRQKNYNDELIHLSNIDEQESNTEIVQQPEDENNRDKNYYNW